MVAHNPIAGIKVEQNSGKSDQERLAMLPCPFCGAEPVFPEAKDVRGTCYDAGCEDCAIATISIQIIDCFDYGESPNREDVNNSWDDENIKYGDKFIAAARNEAIERWNTRTA